MASQELYWKKPWQVVFTPRKFGGLWFKGGKINVTYNCLDRHVLAGRGDKVAYLWESENGNQQQITYQELLARVNQATNFLLSLNLKKGDFLSLYMPLNIEQIIFMLASARLGVVHSVIYAGFSHEAIKTRLKQSKSKYLISGTVTYRRGKTIDLLSEAKKAVLGTSTKLLIADKINLSRFEDRFTPTFFEATNPLFLLYTSGTTGKPKGIIHTMGGYSLYAHITTKKTFGLKGNDRLWCTADLGWITGHSYLVYGPLSNGITSFFYEGVPDYPRPDTWWQLIEKYEINAFYTSPTAIRMLKSYGNRWPNQHQLSSLKVIGSVGEPLDEHSFHWFKTFVGKNHCHLVDTWWQTETGGHVITTTAGQCQKAGWAGKPLFDIVVKVVDQKGRELPSNQKGYLVTASYWPGMFTACYKEPSIYAGYFTTIPGYYFTGDVAIKDRGDYIRILGRGDDVINVAGHNIASFELENIVNQHPAVKESAAVGVTDPLKGQAIVIFIVTSKNKKGVEEKIKLFIEENYGKLARPKKIVLIDKLPKTRSGKIARRVLRAKVSNTNPGDISTLEN